MKIFKEMMGRFNDDFKAITGPFRHGSCRQVCIGCFFEQILNGDFKCISQFLDVIVFDAFALLPVSNCHLANADRMSQFFLGYLSFLSEVSDFGSCCHG